MNNTFYDNLQTELEGLKEQGLFKAERVISSPQQAVISIQDGEDVINFCANNYLGLADHPDLIAGKHRIWRS